MKNLLTPREASEVLHLTVQSITACVKAGAPVYRWGPTGYRYRIDPDEWLEWMKNREPRKKEAPVKPILVNTSALDMAERRHQLMAALKAQVTA